MRYKTIPKGLVILVALALVVTIPVVAALRAVGRGRIAAARA